MSDGKRVVKSQSGTVYVCGESGEGRARLANWLTVGGRLAGGDGGQQLAGRISCMSICNDKIGSCLVGNMERRPGWYTLERSEEGKNYWVMGENLRWCLFYLRKESLINVPFLLLPSRKYRQIIPLDISLFKKNRIHY